MKGRQLVLYGDPVLRQVATRVTEFDDDLRDLVHDMYRIMYEEQGIGLAAPQAGDGRRVFVIDLPTEDDEEPIRFTMVNPEIQGREGSEREEEGCLSIPGIREVVDRAARVVVHFQDVDGTEYELEARDLLARVIQHEYDHLDGILFVDRLPPIRRALLKRRLEDIAAGKVPRESQNATS